MTIDHNNVEAFVDSAAAELTGFGGHLECTICGSVEPLGDVAVHLREGWPTCHGLTMRWWTQRQLDGGEEVAPR